MQYLTAFEMGHSIAAPYVSGLYYLATPYSHERQDIRQVRYEEAMGYAHQLIGMGYDLIEPIGMSHPMAVSYELPTGFDYWRKRDEKLINASTGVIVVLMEGVHDSKGVTYEIGYARGKGLPVYSFEPKSGEFRVYGGVQ